VLHAAIVYPEIAERRVSDYEPEHMGRRPCEFFFAGVTVTINPLAPAAIFWNNRFLRSERAVNRLDRKPT